MKKMLSVVITFLLLFVFVEGIGAGVSLASEKKPIVIGHLHVYSGPMSMFGPACATGVRVAVEEINGAGGILGRPLQLLERDTKLSPVAAVREAKDLVLNKHADILIGAQSSAVALAVSAFAKESKTPWFVIGAKSTSVTEKKGHRYVFRISTNSSSRVKTPVLLAAKQWGEKKVATINHDYEWGHACATQFMEEYSKLVPDAEMVSKVWAPLGTNDFTPYIIKLQTSGAKLLFHSLYGGDYLAFVKQAKAVGLYDTMHVVESVTGDIETVYTIKEGDPSPAGAITSCEWPYWEINNPESKRLAAEFQKRQGQNFASYEACQSYTAIYAIKQAADAVGAFDKEKIIDYLEGSVIDSPVGKIKIRAIDHQAMWPAYSGTVKFTSDLPWPHITDVWYPEPIEEAYHTVEDIESARRGK